MPKALVRAGGGLAALAYSLRKARESGGILRFYKRMRSRNACKTCAYGMGGQHGGMVNEAGHFPEVCKKSIQAQAADMQPPISEEFFRNHAVSELERWSSMQLEHAGRLTFPVAWEEGQTHFRRVEWNDALDRVAAELSAAAPEQTFFYASGRSSNEAAFLLQMLARAYGTRNIHNCSSYCHQASGVALGRMVGSGTATVTLDDLDHTDCAIVAGANPASNHPRLIVKLVELRRRGGTVIVINPLRELGLVRFRIPSDTRSMLFGSTVSDLYLQPHVGSDIALFKALLKGVVESNAADRVYLAEHVDGWDAIVRDLTECSWETLVRSCGVEREQIDRAVEAISKAKRGMVLWAMGLTHHGHGVDNILALANLAVARGWIGRRGAGLMPIRGHSNVQGVGSMGFAPVLKEAYARKMREAYDFGDEGGVGLDTYGSMVAADEGKIRTSVLLGGNLWGSNPDLEWAGSALKKIGATAHITTKLNQGHIHGRGRYNVLLPVFARDEEVQATTQESMFNFVRLSDGGSEPPPGELKSEVEVVNALASRILPSGPFPFEAMTNHHAIREAIAKVVPGFSAIADIDSTREEFQIAGRTFHEPRFATPSGRLQAHVTPLEVFSVPEGSFRLMTIRSEGQFNTVVYEEEDVYRGNRRRDVVMMNARDAVRLHLGEHDPVTVVNETGSMQVVVAFADLPPGNVAMYSPEANVLVPRRLDSMSGTPAFKSVAVRIEK